MFTSTKPDLHKAGPSSLTLEDLVSDESFVWVVYWYESAGFLEGFGKAVARDCNGELWYKYLDHCSCHGVRTERDDDQFRPWHRMSNQDVTEFFNPIHALSSDEDSLIEHVKKLMTQT